MFYDCWVYTVLTLYGRVASLTDSKLPLSILVYSCVCKRLKKILRYFKMTRKFDNDRYIKRIGLKIILSIPI